MRVADILTRLTEWTAIGDFVVLVDAHFREPRTAQETADYRLGKGRKTFKKFRDEIVPAYHFVVATGVSGSIRFALSDSMPDCWIRHEGQPTSRGIEITRANVKEQLWNARELNQHGPGEASWGFLTTIQMRGMPMKSDENRELTQQTRCWKQGQRGYSAVSSGKT